MRSGARRGGLTAALMIGVLAAPGCAYYRLELQREKIANADVIIVPGLALDEDGRGVPILWNRVLMARVARDRGHASSIIVSGGKPRRGITESAKMLEYAGRLGIPPEAVIEEPRATSSVENGRFSAELMVARGLRSALVVSDDWHLRYAIPVFRDAFEELGLELYWLAVDAEAVAATGLARDDDDPHE